MTIDTSKRAEGEKKSETSNWHSLAANPTCEWRPQRLLPLSLTAPPRGLPDWQLNCCNGPLVVAVETSLGGPSLTGPTWTPPTILAAAAALGAGAQQTGPGAPGGGRPRRRPRCACSNLSCRAAGLLVGGTGAHFGCKLDWLAAWLDGRLGRRTVPTCPAYLQIGGPSDATTTTTSGRGRRRAPLFVLPMDVGQVLLVVVVVSISCLARGAKVMLRFSWLSLGGHKTSGWASRRAARRSSARLGQPRPLCQARRQTKQTNKQQISRCAPT